MNAGKDQDRLLSPNPKAPSAPPKSRRYSRPRLTKYGHVCEVTLGGSPGIPDSGIGQIEQAQP